ncbi:MAG TPA: hypothetical protein VKK19_07705 [Candidatus Dormibacteraeota bacterium]|nr:hypothetical protein [Candidatus Dormibacteraeota bacterium]
MSTPSTEADGFNNEFLDGTTSNLQASVSLLAGARQRRYEL